MQRFGRSWVKNVEAAGISNWLVAALDPWTSKVLGSWGSQCFNAPMDKLPYHGKGKEHQWGSSHWMSTTWNKVHVVAAVHELGFHVIHSDADVTWFQDPMPFFSQYLEGPAHVLFSTDELKTMNDPEDQGLEAMAADKIEAPEISINTGVYFIRHWPGGHKFFQEWFGLKAFELTDRIHEGHDQDSLNVLVRGTDAWNDPRPPYATWLPGQRFVRCAYDNDTVVGFLPISMFGNAYTYVLGQVHQRLNHPLYEVHWVWSGSTMESKQQTMRDAMKFWDNPEYYSSPSLVTLDIWVPQMFENFNDSPLNETERMVQFHVNAANIQLRQLYYGFIAAVALNRVLLMPKLQCFCAKNWYMTYCCRIQGEMHTFFPFDCPLSHLLRAKKLLHGLVVKAGRQKGSVTIREHSFLENPNVPDEIKRSRLVLVPAAQPRPSSDVSLPSTAAMREEHQTDGSVHMQVPWPLDDEELTALLAPLQKRFRIIHLANATKILGRRFHSIEFQKKFNEEISKMTTYWCCRSQEDMERFNATDRVHFSIVPAEHD